MGCHMGQRGVDKPVVRYVTGEVAQAAHEALRTSRLRDASVRTSSDCQPSGQERGNRAGWHDPTGRLEARPTKARSTFPHLFFHVCPCNEACS